MSPGNFRNNKACNDAIAMLESGGKTLWAVEVIRNRIRLILTDPKKVAHNEEFKKLVLADDASGEAPRLGLADREDLSVMRRIAVSALHGIPHCHVDVSHRKFAIVDGERITV